VKSHTRNEENCSFASFLHLSITARPFLQGKERISCGCQAPKEVRGNSPGADGGDRGSTEESPKEQPHSFCPRTTRASPVSSATPLPMLLLPSVEASGALPDVIGDALYMLAESPQNHPSRHILNKSPYHVQYLLI
jgi:hypothetical protein